MTILKLITNDEIFSNHAQLAPLYNLKMVKKVLELNKNKLICQIRRKNRNIFLLISTTNLCLALLKPGIDIILVPFTRDVPYSRLGETPHNEIILHKDGRTNQ